MKTEEDEAFDDLAKRQGAWGGGFPAKRQMAADKINADFDEEYKKMHEDRIKYGASWSQDGKRIDPMNVYKELAAMDDRQRLEAIVSVICRYLPPDGIPINDAMSEIISYVDPLPAPQPAQEPVAHLWECLGRWSAYLVENGKQADCAPPSWLVDAINKATTPPLPAQRPWIGLTEKDFSSINQSCLTKLQAATSAESILKERNS